MGNRDRHYILRGQCGSDKYRRTGANYPTYHHHLLGMSFHWLLIAAALLALACAGSNNRHTTTAPEHGSSPATGEPSRPLFELNGPSEDGEKVGKVASEALALAHGKRLAYTPHRNGSQPGVVSIPVNRTFVSTHGVSTDAPEEDATTTKSSTGEMKSHLLSSSEESVGGSEKETEPSEEEIALPTTKEDKDRMAEQLKLLLENALEQAKKDSQRDFMRVNAKGSLDGAVSDGYVVRDEMVNPFSGLRRYTFSKKVGNEGDEDALVVSTLCQTTYTSISIHS